MEDEDTEKHCYPRGEKHGRSKLTETQVREILALRGIVTQRELAQRYGVALGTISCIHLGKKWGHIGRRNGRRQENG